MRNTALFGAIAIWVLSGCGGSGDSGGTVGGSNPPAGADITSDNAPTIAAATLESSLQAGDLGDFAGFSPLPTATATATNRQLLATFSDIQSDYAEQLQQTVAAGTAQLVIVEETVECPVAGTITVTIDVANEATLQVGDSISADYADCVLGEGVVVDGLFSMTVSALSGDLNSGQTRLGFDVEVASFMLTAGEESASMNGDLSITIDTLNPPVAVLSVSSASLTVSGSDGTHTLSDYVSVRTFDSSATSFTLEMSGTLTSSSFEGAVDFETVVTLQGLGDAYAFAGQILISGADGTILVTVVDQVNVRLEIDSNGDGIVDETIDTTWDALLNGTV